MEVIRVIQIVSNVVLGVSGYYSINGNENIRKTARVISFISLAFVIICAQLQ